MVKVTTGTTEIQKHLLYIIMKESMPQKFKPRNLDMFLEFLLHTKT